VTPVRIVHLGPGDKAQVDAVDGTVRRA